jgi:hypothetical protein
MHHFIDTCDETYNNTLHPLHPSSNNPHKLVTRTWSWSDTNVITKVMDVTKGTPPEVSRVADRLPQFAIEEPEPLQASPRNMFSHSWTTVMPGKCGTLLFLHLSRTHTPNWRPSCWTDYPHRDGSAPTGSSQARKWATANHHSSWDTSGNLALMCRTTYCVLFGPVG